MLVFCLSRKVSDDVSMLELRVFKMYQLVCTSLNACKERMFKEAHLNIKQNFNISLDSPYLDQFLTRRRATLSPGKREWCQ